MLPPDGGLPAGAMLDVTTRLPAPLFGRAYLEAILDSEIERVAGEQSLRSDGVHGRVNRVSFRSARPSTRGFRCTSRERTGSSGGSG